MIPISNRLRETVAKAKHDFDALSEDQAAKPATGGKWSRKQILGHLLDSATNNHRRFLKALLEDEVRLPSYPQQASVQAQRYQDMKWAELAAFWESYNRFLAHVLAGVPEAKRKTPCFIGNNPVMTLEELAEDYLVHMQHHLEQIRART